MKRNIISAFLVLTMVVCLLPVPAGAAETTLKSGDLSAAKLTKEEIVELLENNPASMPETVFDAQPSCSAPYATGKVSSAALNAVLNRLNALRTLAGVPKVTLDQGLCDNAQYGAVLLGSIGNLSHYPDQPSDMDDAFYQEGYQATSSSNIAAGYSFTGAIDGFMDDSDAYNVARVGHRMWQLNPTMGKVGFGYVDNGNGWGGKFTVEKVFDNSGTGCSDYNFIGWPASGNFPNNTAAFDRNSAWSIRLNSYKYSIPDTQNITLTLTRESDGKTWSFSGRKTYPENSFGEYFTCDTDTIIFRPDGITSYEGVYTVTVNGLTRPDGITPVTNFSYQVDFFNPRSFVEVVNAKAATCTQDGYTGDTVCSVCGRLISSGTTIPATGHHFGAWITVTAATYSSDGLEERYCACGAKESNVLPRKANPFVDVTQGQYYYDAVLWAVDNGITNGTSANTFSPNADCNRAQIVTFLWRAMGCPAPASTSNPFVDVAPTDFYYSAVLWAVEKGITNGIDATHFGPSVVCNRAQSATFLWRTSGSPAPASPSNPFVDVAPGVYYYDSVLWAVENAITNGTGANTFSPGATCSRGQIVTFLYRYLAN